MRQLVLDAGYMGKRKHMMHGFVEVDVTDVRAAMRAQTAAGGPKPSFTAFIAYCLGQAVAADRRVQSLRSWRNQLVTFDDVDALVSIEVQVDHGTFPLVHVLRAIDKRSVADIQAEIRAIQSTPKNSVTQHGSLMRYFYWLPSFVRRLLYRTAVRVPSLWREQAGTVGLTSVGMFGKGGGWGTGMPVHPLAITIGGIAEKPRMVDGRCVPREMLCVTISFDHDVVDGAPAARFASRFCELIESGAGVQLVPEEEPWMQPS
jgi:pyruvate/2-oxoglutarate dehydrogenase complex dihydrolipoamide acyltransferase (E2) component